MFKYFVTLHTGYGGEDSHDVFESNRPLSEAELADVGWELACDWASSYGRELCSDDCENPDCEDEHSGSTNIEGHLVPYVPEEHDMYLV